MKVTEKRKYDHTIRKICDVCGKEIDIKDGQNMIEIVWSSGGWQGTKQYFGASDVCSTNCFVLMIPKIKKMWASIIRINNVEYFD